MPGTVLGAGDEQRTEQTSPAGFSPQDTYANTKKAGAGVGLGGGTVVVVGESSQRVTKKQRKSLGLCGEGVRGGGPEEAFLPPSLECASRGRGQGISWLLLHPGQPAHSRCLRKAGTAVTVGGGRIMDRAGPLVQGCTPRPSGHPPSRGPGCEGAGDPSTGGGPRGRSSGAFRGLRRQVGNRHVILRAKGSRWRAWGHG